MVDKNVVNEYEDQLNILSDCEPVAGTEKCVVFTGSLPLPTVSKYDTIRYDTIVCI